MASDFAGSRPFDVGRSDDGSICSHRSVMGSRGGSVSGGVHTPIAGARERLSLAERQLRLALQGVMGGPRAEKIAASDEVQRAFAGLREARAGLARLLEPSQGQSPD
jgi:hypothetical protein